MTRRDLLLSSLASLTPPSVAVEHKTLSCGKHSSIIVVTVEDLTDGEAERIYTHLADAYPDQRFLVVPDNVEVKAVPTGYYHREKLGAYEIEICAGSEKEVLDRLDAVGGKVVRK